MLWSGGGLLVERVGFSWFLWREAGEGGQCLIVFLGEALCIALSWLVNFRQVQWLI